MKVVFLLRFLSFIDHLNLLNKLCVLFFYPFNINNKLKSETLLNFSPELS